MANDGSQASILETWIAQQLAAITVEEVVVFRTAEVWAWQIDPRQSGEQAFLQYAPFAFVGHIPDYDAARQGDFDLSRDLQLAVMIGQTAKQKGVARHGDADTLGTNRLAELVIATLDRQRPADAACLIDSLRYTGALQVLETPHSSMVQLEFKAPWIAG